MKTFDLEAIEKVLNNEATPEQAGEVVKWLGTPEGQEWLSARMDNDRERMEGEEEAFLDHPIPMGEMYRTIMQKLRRRKMRRFLFRVAAVLIPFVLLVGMFFKLNSQVELFGKTVYDEIHAPKGERLQVVFQDGSRAFLNSDSRIKYPRKFGLTERKIELEGEAWFSVTENKKRPFIVDVRSMEVCVRGTEFDVKAYPEDTCVYVTLETGKVQLKAPTTGSLVLYPGDKATFNRSTGKYLVAQPEEPFAASAWKDNVLVFENASLSEVISTLDRAFNVTFEVQDSTVLQYTYRLRTEHTDLSPILQELEKITPVHFEKQDSVIRVYKK